MSIFDVTSQLNVTFLDKLVIVTATTTFTNSFNSNEFDPGIMLSVYITGSLKMGDFVVTLQQSSDDSNWSDVPENKLINRFSDLPLELILQEPGSSIPTLGTFSNDDFLRYKIVSTGGTVNATVLTVATGKRNFRPKL